MKKRFVIANTPVKLPIQSTILYSFLLYFFNASDVVWAIFITLWVIYWIIALVAVFNQEAIDLNSEDLDEKKKAIESRFAQRLYNIISEHQRKEHKE